MIKKATPYPYSSKMDATVSPYSSAGEKFPSGKLRRSGSTGQEPSSSMFKRVASVFLTGLILEEESESQQKMNQRLPQLNKRSKANNLSVLGAPVTQKKQVKAV